MLPYRVFTAACAAALLTAGAATAAPYPPVADGPMKGWTTLTTTKVSKGASIFRSAVADYAVVTRPDGGLSLSRINMAFPSPIPPAAWKVLTKAGSLSEPHCTTTPDATSSVKYYIFCLTLNATGKAQFTNIYSTSSADFTVVGTSTALDGMALTSAPVFMAPTTKATAGYPYVFQFTAGAISMSGQLSARNMKINQALYGATTDGSGAWADLATTFKGVPGCTADSQLCAGVTADNRVALFHYSGASGNNTPFMFGASPVVAAGLSGEVAAVTLTATKYVIVARGKDGQLYEIVYDNNSFSPWKAEGGAVMPLTQPSCLPSAAGASCVVQGADGYLYAKAM